GRDVAGKPAVSGRPAQARSDEEVQESSRSEARDPGGAQGEEGIVLGERSRIATAAAQVAEEGEDSSGSLGRAETSRLPLPYRRSHGHGALEPLRAGAACGRDCSVRSIPGSRGWCFVPSWAPPPPPRR